MVQQLERGTYSAVLCRSCREPIPVPAIVIRMHETARTEAPDAVQSERVFTLRCRACEAEKPYRSSQVIEVDGQPKVRRAASRGDVPLARAAGA